VLHSVTLSALQVLHRKHFTILAVQNRTPRPIGDCSVHQKTTVRVVNSIQSNNQLTRWQKHSSL